MQSRRSAEWPAGDAGRPTAANASALQKGCSEHGPISCDALTDNHLHLAQEKRAITLRIFSSRKITERFKNNKTNV